MNFDDKILIYGQKLEQLNNDLSEWNDMFGDSEKKRNKIRNLKEEFNNVSIEMLPHIIKKTIFHINNNDILKLDCLLCGYNCLNKINWDSLRTDIYLDIDKIIITEKLFDLLSKVLDSKICIYLLNGICKTGDFELIKFLDDKNELFTRIHPQQILKTSIIFGHDEIIKWILQKDLLVIQSLLDLFNEFCTDVNIKSNIIKILYDTIKKMTILNLDDKIMCCFYTNNIICFERLVDFYTDKELIKKICIYCIIENKFDFLKIVLPIYSNIFMN
jgi:uncharacterized protein YjgD (DUF1641 family)